MRKIYMWYEWWGTATRKMCLLVAVPHRIFFGWATATRENGFGGPRQQGNSNFFGFFFLYEFRYIQLSGITPNQHLHWVWTTQLLMVLLQQVHSRSQMSNLTCHRTEQTCTISDLVAISDTITGWFQLTCRFIAKSRCFAETSTTISYCCPRRSVSTWWNLHSRWDWCAR